MQIEVMLQGWKAAKVESHAFLSGSEKKQPTQTAEQEKLLRFSAPILCKNRGNEGKRNDQGSLVLPK